MANQETERITGTSLDISAENRAQLKQLFPSVFTETKNDKGDLVESIDFEKLKAELGTFSDLFESRRERYGMDWPGKKEALRLIQTPSAATLKPCREESVNFDTTENLFIEGDNLEVLKLLQKSYYGKIKMIYIDPPYNTGKEFIYPDNYSESLETYLEYAGLTDSDGKKFSTNTTNEGRFHTKWLNMMYPRLYLARNLLREDGVIFISIDDNEVSNLRKLCDEIFGEENFVAHIVWQKKYAATNDAQGISVMHDHIIVYQKSESFERILLPRTEEQNKPYKNDDGDGKGLWRSDNLLVKSFSTSGVYPIINPNTHKEFMPPEGSCWRASPGTMKTWLSENRIFFGKDGQGAPQLKRYLKEVQDGRVPTTWWPFEEVGHNDAANKELKSLFESKAPFDTPKPSSLVKRMLQISSIGNIESDDEHTSNIIQPVHKQNFSEPDIILDFFAGSGTTAHAVLDLNNQDFGNRKFILVQLPEPCDQDSDAFKFGYKTIAEIGKERVRRVIDKMKLEIAKKLEEDKTKVPGLFDGERRLSNGPDKIDLGFKVFKLDKSNFKQWQKLDPTTPVERIEEQLTLHIEHIDHQATPEDLLYEILLKTGFSPTATIETKIIADSKVFSVADGALLLCLEDTVTKELIDNIAEIEPMQFICLDSAFHSNDQLKANAVQTFAARNMQKEKHNQIIFKTI